MNSILKQDVKKSSQIKRIAFPTVTSTSSSLTPSASKSTSNLDVQKNVEKLSEIVKSIKPNAGQSIKPNAGLGNGGNGNGNGNGGNGNGGNGNSIYKSKSSTLSMSEDLINGGPEEESETSISETITPQGTTSLSFEETEEESGEQEEQPLELRKLIASLQKEPVTKVVSSCDAIIKMNSECPACVAPIPLLKKTLSEESKFLDQFTDQQLNIIGLDKNIPEVVISSRTRKIQLIIADPYKMPIDYSLALDAFNDGELLYVAANEKIPVQRIPDGFNTRRVLVALILYQRKRSDLIQNMMLTDDDLRTMVQVIEGCGETPYSFILPRAELEEIIDTGNFPTCNQDFLARWQRYETLRVLPPSYLESLSYQIPPKQIGNMSPNESYMIARLLDVPSNPFELRFAKERNFTRESIKNQYGILVPPTWLVLDYIALNGFEYPTYTEYDEFLMEKLVSIPTLDCKTKYVERFNDVQIFTELKNYVPYNSRNELIKNVLQMMNENGEVYFYSLIEGFENVIFFGNYIESQKLNERDIIDKLDFISVQPYSLEDRLEVLKQTRQLQTLLLNAPVPVSSDPSKQIILLTPGVAAALARAITNLESNVSLRPYLEMFLQMDKTQIAITRKVLYQKYYYAQTRNSLYVSSLLKSEFYDSIPKVVNINTPNPNTIQNKEAQQLHQDNLYQSILLFKLFFGHIPHSHMVNNGDRLAATCRI